MNATVVISLGSTALAVAISLLVYMLGKGQERGFVSLLAGVVVWMIAVLVGTVSLTQRVSAHTAFFDNHWRMTAVVDKELTLWYRNPLLNDQQIVYDKRFLSVPMKARITENPKVRAFSYDVTVEILGSPEDAQKFYAHAYRTPGWLWETDWLRYDLYNFNDGHSKELAKFSNPLDPDQQRRFWNLVSSFLAADLSRASARLTRVHFDLE